MSLERSKGHGGARATIPMHMKRTVAMLLCPVAAFALSAAGHTTARAAEQTLGPAAGGTIADGGAYGPFDGVGDVADWSFNESSFEGAITLVREPPPALEQRCVFEFSLAAITIPAPLTAYLDLKLRGAPRFPAEIATVEVFAYQADLAESIDDYVATSLGSVGQVPIAPYQPATSYALNVSDLVNARRSANAVAVGFRIEIMPESPNDSLQVFMDVLDSDPATQPALRLIDRVPGDGNNDRTLNRDDADLVLDCLSGPDARRSTPCAVFDFDLDGDADLTDFARFERALTLYGP